MAPAKSFIMIIKRSKHLVRNHIIQAKDFHEQ